MSNSTINLESVINTFTTPCSSLSNKEKDAVRNSFLQQKAILDTKRESLLAQLPNGKQPLLQKTIRTLHHQAVQTLSASLNLIDSLFPRIDISFLNLSSGNRPCWALFNADLKTDTFSIIYLKDLVCSKNYGWNGKHPLQLNLYPGEDRPRIEPACFQHFFNYQNGHVLHTPLTGTLNKPLRQYLAEQVLGLSPEACNEFLEFGGVVIQEPFNKACKDLIPSSPNQARTSLELKFTATFTHFVPPSVENNIETFRLLFDEMFFVAEIPD